MHSALITSMDSMGDTLFLKQMKADFCTNILRVIFPRKGRDLSALFYLSQSYVYFLQKNWCMLTVLSINRKHLTLNQENV